MDQPISRHLILQSNYEIITNQRKYAHSTGLAAGHCERQSPSRNDGSHLQSACVLDIAITGFGGNSILVARSESRNRVGNASFDDKLEFLTGCETRTMY